jgi:hypothetical protein
MNARAGHLSNLPGPIHSGNGNAGAGEACATSADCGDGLCGLSGSNQCAFDETLACLDASSECRSTTCEDGLEECVCYADSGDFRCHAECFSGGG